VSVADPGDHRELDDPYSAGAPLVTIEHTASEEATVTDEKEEGWYTDPFGQHEARWMSAGTPTKLVRDRGVESYDDPPDVEPTQVPKRIVSEPPREPTSAGPTRLKPSTNRPVATSPAPRYSERSHPGIGTPKTRTVNPLGPTGHRTSHFTPAPVGSRSARGAGDSRR